MDVDSEKVRDGMRWKLLVFAKVDAKARLIFRRRRRHVSRRTFSRKVSRMSLPTATIPLLRNTTLRHSPLLHSYCFSPSRSERVRHAQNTHKTVTTI